MALVAQNGQFDDAELEDNDESDNESDDESDDEPDRKLPP